MLLARLSLATLTAASAFPQNSTAAILDTVTDSSGAAIAGASVEVRHTDQSIGAVDDRAQRTAGLSSRNRLLLVSHTDRGGKLRIISARPLTRKERKGYEGTQ